MTKLLGVPDELWVRVTRKRGDDNYGSYGVEAELKVNLANAEDLNLDDAFTAVDAWLTAAVAASMKAKTAELAPKTQVNVEAAATVAQTPPPAPTEAPPPPPAPPQASGPVETHEILKDCSISHQVTGSGIHHLLVKGGKFSKYGVKMWPEKASEFIEHAWQEWPIGKDYGLPDGYKPDRCVGLR